MKIEHKYRYTCCVFVTFLQQTWWRCEACTFYAVDVIYSESVLVEVTHTEWVSKLCHY
jgi:hypothetical protein